MIQDDVKTDLFLYATIDMTSRNRSKTRSSNAD